MPSHPKALCDLEPLTDGVGRPEEDAVRAFPALPASLLSGTPADNATSKIKSTK